jgi:hypothetical protein
LRNKVERLINRLKQARRIATRHEKRGDNYLAMVHIGMILLWLKPFADTAYHYSCISPMYGSHALHFVAIFGTFR